MDTIEKLDAVEDIKKLEARYFRFVDTKQWDALRHIFTMDATFDVAGSGMQQVDGRDAFVAFASAGLVDCVSVHHSHCPEIKLLSRASAAGIWPMEDMLQWAEGSTSPLRSMHRFGHYFENYEKVGGEWKIAT